jgi:hypothetical protein
MEAIVERLLGVYKDWTGVDVKIQPSGRPAMTAKDIQALWADAQGAEQTLDFQKALWLYETIQQAAPESDLAKKAKERIAAIQARQQKPGGNGN